MSATEIKNKKREVPFEHKQQVYYQINPSYTVRVICCVLFIFLTEICLAHYVYRLISSEIRDNYISKHEIPQYFINYIRSDPGRFELSRLWKEIKSNEEFLRNNRRKRGTVDDNSLSGGPGNEPHVEFINPSSAKQQNVNKDAGDKSWVWLTAYSRIPVSLSESQNIF